MKAHSEESITLLELLICITLVGIIVLGFFSIHIFSRYHLVTSARRADLQNDIAYILEHMAQKINGAVGNEKANGAYSVIDISTGAIDIYIDANGNGQSDPPVLPFPSSSDDHWITYRYETTGPQSFQMRYCGLCRNANCNLNQCLDSVETLSTKITNFLPIVNRNPSDNTLRDNYVEIWLTACWDPTNLATCGYSENPDVSMTSRIKMPSVSTR